MNQGIERKPKTKEEKEEFKAKKILEKQKRKEKSLLNHNEENLLESVKGLSIFNETKSKLHRVRKASDMVTFQDPNIKPDAKIIEKINCEIAAFIRTEETKKPLYFGHLYYPDRQISALKCIEVNSNNIHSKIRNFGLQLDSYQIRGSTLRCQEFLKVLKCMILDLPMRNDEDFPQACAAAINDNIDFLNKCRPISITTCTAINYLKMNLSLMNKNNVNNYREALIGFIDQFLKERIDVAHEYIQSLIFNYIKKNSSILIYSYSQIVFKSIIYAWNNLKPTNFQVIVVDTFPDSEGQKMIEILKKHGIPYYKTNLAGILQIMRKIDLVILGTISVMSNGNIVSCSGAASIANIANSYSKKVIVCAETFKFSMDNKSNSFDFNELAHPNLFVNEICKESLYESKDVIERFRNWRDSNSNVTVIFPLYDVIQGNLIDGICCELGIISPSTVSHVSRVKLPF